MKFELTIDFSLAIEGYIILVTNLHDEATEEEVVDLFSDFGEVQNIHLNLDRQTGYVKGYALIEYKTFAEAEQAVTNGTGMDFLGRNLEVDYAFVKPPAATIKEGSTFDRSKTVRSRSKSPIV